MSTTQPHDQADDATPADTGEGVQSWTPEATPEPPETGPESHETHDDGQLDLSAELDSLRTENAALQAQVQRLTVATEKGVPPELLTAAGVDELQAQADALLAFAESQRRPVDFGGGRRGDGEPQHHDQDRDPLRTVIRGRR